MFQRSHAVYVLVLNLCCRSGAGCTRLGVRKHRSSRKIKTHRVGVYVWILAIINALSVTMLTILHLLIEKLSSESGLHRIGAFSSWGVGILSACTFSASTSVLVCDCGRTEGCMFVVWVLAFALVYFTGTDWPTDKRGRKAYNCRFLLNHR